MAMIRDVAKRLASIEAGLVVGGKALTPMLASVAEQLQAFDLPSVSNVPRQASRSLQGGYSVIERTWQLIVYVAEVGLTLTTVAEDVAYEAIDLMYEALDKRPQLQDDQGAGLEGVIEARVVRDSGLQAPLFLPSTSNPQRGWWGVTFDLLVRSVKEGGC